MGSERLPIDNDLMMRVKELYFDGKYPIEDVCSKLHISMVDVRKCIHQLNRMFREERKKNEFIRLIESGYKEGEIAKKLGCSYSNVTRLKSVYGVTSDRVKGYDQISDSDLLLLSYKELKEKYKINFSEVHKVRKSRGMIRELLYDRLDEKTLKELEKEGKSIEDICVMYEVSPSSVVRMYQMANLKCPSYARANKTLWDLKDSVELIKKYVEEDKKDFMIIRDFGITFSQVKYFKKKYNITNKIAKTGIISLSKFEELYIIEGKTVESIANLYNLGTEDVEILRIRYKIPKL